MYHPLTLLLFCIFFFFDHCQAFQKNQDWHLQHYTDENGLPQNSVKFIAPDEKGFIWLSTEDGLVRFDGSKFLRFGKGNLALSSNRFSAFYKNIHGKGLFSYNEKGEQVRIEKGKAMPDTVSLSWVERRENYAPGHSWVPGTKYFDGHLNAQIKLKSGFERVVIPAKRNNVYVYDGDTLTYYKQDKLSRRVLFHTRDDWNFFLINEQLYLLQEDGTVTSLSGPVINRPLQGDILLDPVYKKAGRYSAVLWNICVHNQVILYFNRCFYIVSENKPGLLDTKLIFSGFNDFEEKNICGAYYNDRSGQLYLGSTANGLYILSPKPFTTLTSNRNNNVYYGQVSYPDNKLYTTQNTMFDLSGGLDKVRTVTKKLSSDFYSMFIDAKGYTWTKWRYWVYKYAPSLQLAGSWILPDLVSTLYEGKVDKVWLGLGNGDIYSLSSSLSSGSPVLFTSVNERVNYILQTGPDTLVVGTENGLYRLGISTGKVDTIDGMKNKQIRSIHASGTNELWITTYGDGFFLFDNGKLTKFPLDKDGYLSVSHCIVEDKRGFFWIPTNKGLFQVARTDLLDYATNPRRQLYYYYYDKSEGFNTNEFNGGCQPCAAQLPNGYVSFPSLNGLVIFKPDSIPYYLPGKELFIDEVKMDGQLLNLDELANLPRQFGQITFTISSPYPGNPKNLQIWYALVEKGHSPIWLAVPASGIISLSAIPVGQYSLLIRKLNGFGKNDYTQLSLAVKVAPPWYQTSWSYLTGILLLAISCFLSIRLRTRYIRKMNQQLEQTITNKTKQLQRKTDIQQKIIHAVNHDIQTPLYYQKLLSARVYETILNEKKSPFNDMVKVLNDSTHHLYYMVENLLKYLKMQISGDSNPAERVDLFRLAEDKLMIFKEIAREKGTSISNNIQPDFSFSGDAHLISVILHNLMDNAVKVTWNGKITIVANESNGEFCLTVCDTGPGMPAHLQEWINNPRLEFSLQPGEDMDSIHGIGLMMIKELSALLGIKLLVWSEAGTGTSFSVLWAQAGKPL